MAFMRRYATIHHNSGYRLFDLSIQNEDNCCIGGCYHGLCGIHHLFTCEIRPYNSVGTLFLLLQTHKLMDFDFILELREKKPQLPM